MIYFIYPSKDTTLYKQRNLLELNTGYDEILEIKKINTDSDGVVLSRILLEFDNKFFEKNQEKLLSSEFHLNLKVANSSELSMNDELAVYPIKKYWDEGVGRFHDSEDSAFYYEGASWRFADSKKNYWKQDATDDNYVGGGDYYEHEEIPHKTNSPNTDELIFKFQRSFSDVKINITSIVKSWLSGDIQNNGILIKFIRETSDTHSSIQFFSKDTNTIYYPYLEVLYNDYKFEPCENVYYKTIECETHICGDVVTEELNTFESGSLTSGSIESWSIESGSITSGSTEYRSHESGSLESGNLQSGTLESTSLDLLDTLESASLGEITNENLQCSNENNTSGTYRVKKENILVKKSNINQLFADNFIPTIKTIKSEYKQTERKKIRVGVRNQRPIKTFSSKSDYSLDNFVTHDMYYSISDAETQETIIDFCEYTKISCDSRGHYFNFDFGCLAVGRFYRFAIQTEVDSEIEVYEDTRNFRIRS
jgi:hypothetical protein